MIDFLLDNDHHDVVSCTLSLMLLAHEAETYEEKPKTPPHLPGR